MRHVGIRLVLVLLVLCFLVSPAFGQEAETVDDKTLSPYFFIPGGDESIDQLPLQSTRADVEIAGVIARVLVTQVYKNEGTRPIEAVYVFPGSTRAAVFGMRMTVGERVIEARIEERQKARADYEQARAQGKSAGLLEQQRPNVFQMNVANIMPGDVIRVELDYTELLVPEDGTYEFVYPTVVGPRYSNMPREGASDRDAWVENPYLRQGDPEPFTFDIRVALNSGIPIAKMTCPSHDADFNYEGSSTAIVTLKDTKGAGTKDFVLRYNLEGDRVQSGILLYPGKDENFFLIMMEPPARVGGAMIPPREYIFVLDVSGSMNGFPLDTAKKLMRNLIGKLRETDTFNVVLFSGRAAVLSEKSLPATQENIEKAMNTIDNQNGGGGTELINALNTAFSLPRQEENVSRTTVIVTDGYVNCETEAFDLIRNNLNKSNVFAFGIGSSVNRHLIEGMAHCGAGEPLIVTGPAEADPKAEKFREYIQSPVLTQIAVDFQKFKAYDVEPVSVPDVLADRPVIVFGKYKGMPTGSIRILGHSGSGVDIKSDCKMILDLDPDMEDESNVALRYLWARRRIKTLSDYNNLRHDEERVREVTTLGLTYSLLTDYTSFIAIDSLVRNANGDTTKVVQPLPLPDGVSDLAVGGSSNYAMAPRKMQNVRAAGKLTEMLSFARPMSAMPTEEKGRIFTPTASKTERDEAESLPTGHSGREIAAANAPVPATEPAPANKVAGDKSAVSPQHMAKGAFRSDGVEEKAPLTGGITENERSGELAVATTENLSIKLLIGGLSVMLVLVVLWRRNGGRADGRKNGDLDS